MLETEGLVLAKTSLKDCKHNGLKENYLSAPWLFQLFSYFSVQDPFL